MSTPRSTVSRRGLLAGLATASVAGMACASESPQPEAAAAAPAGKVLGEPVPTRPLGKCGARVPMIALGGAMARHTPEFLEAAWDRGVRYFDTARLYTTNTANGRSEENIADFFKAHPERRKDIFLVSKSYFRGEQPEAVLTDIDVRLEKCGVDHLDLYFMHAMGTQDYGEDSLNWFKSDRVREIAQQLKESGKIKHFGFSSHHARKEDYLLAAAEGGFVDAIMVAYTPFMKAGDKLDEALTACHEKGIGLIAMKEMRALGDLPKRSPEMDALGLNNHQALLHACWSDDRIASICSAMENEQHIDENLDAARKFERKLASAEMESLRRVIHSCRAATCPNCDGRCETAAGTTAGLADIARYVAYYEQDGARAAREWYLNLPEHRRDAAGANLFAAHRACLAHLDFESIVEKARRYFA